MSADERLSRNEGLAPAFAAMRARLAVVALLFALAGIGWWRTAGQMRGMDNGPWTGLGAVELVPRCLGRDDGSHDVPIRRAHCRLVFAHDPETIAAVAHRLHHRISGHVGGRRGRWRSP